MFAWFKGRAYKVLPLLQADLTCAYPQGSSEWNGGQKAKEKTLSKHDEDGKNARRMKVND
jgi:hypothetical protein